MRMSRFGRIATPLRPTLFLVALALAPPPARAQTSLFDPRFDDIRRASVAWDNRSGPEREVVDVVCLVPDLPTYFEAIAAWDERRYFPVLIDHAETTLRFLRAFKPSRIVRFPAKVDPIEPEALWGQAVAAVGRSWASDGEAPRGDAVPKALGLTPPGVVIAHPESPSLAGAVALAAGRFQPLLRWSTPKKFSEVATFEEAGLYARGLETLIADLGLRHDKLGDECDFVTLAGDYPYRYQAKGRPTLHETKGEPTAFDDLILRNATDGRRWAYAGRLIGDPAESAYRAMCGLFLSPKPTLMFNSYGDQTLPWTDYAMAGASGRLSGLLTVTHRFGDRANLTGWHQAFDPLNKYGLALINTSGNPTSFNLPGGPGQTADVPEGAPVAVHMIHSFSAQAPDDPDTLAGRWLKNGAFLYYGAIHEPYLVAFRPPGLIATFLSENLPLVAALRRSEVEPFGDPWRLIYLGDPLYRIKPIGATAGPRVAWDALDAWPSYKEPDPDPTGPPSLRKALQTAIFRLQTGTPPRHRRDLADDLLAIRRDQLDAALRPVYDDLLADTLLNAGRAPELRERLERVSPPDRTPNLRRHLETAQTSALQRAVAGNDLRIALDLWQDVIRAKGSRDFARTFTERVGRLAESAGKLGEWRTRLQTVRRSAAEPANRPVVDEELGRVEGKLAARR